MTSADLRWHLTAVVVNPIQRRATHSRLVCCQEVYVVKFILFRLDLSLLDAITALAAISPLVCHHEGIVYHASHS
jgi:hypothetical protein